LNISKIIIATLPVLFLSGCFEEKWEGFVYPDASDLTISRSVGIFSTLEECRDAALLTLTGISSVRSGDYECGLNCEARSNLGGIKICEKTVR
jgi:hypothetical protein